MSKEAQYIILHPYWDADDWGDHRPNPKWEESIYFHSDKDLKNLTALAKEYGIKKWAEIDDTPYDYDKWASKKGDKAMLLQVRPCVVKPITYVTEWGYSPNANREI